MVWRMFLTLKTSTSGLASKEILLDHKFIQFQRIVVRPRVSPHRRKFIEVKCRVGFNWANFIECGQHVTVECRVESLDEHDYANNKKPLIVIQINGEQIEVLLPLKSIISSYCCSHFRSVSPIEKCLNSGLSKPSNYHNSFVHRSDDNGILSPPASLFVCPG